MRKEYAGLRRRPLLTPVWLVALGALLTLAAFAWTLSAASTTLVVVVSATEDATAQANGLPPAARAAALGRVLYADQPGADIAPLLISTAPAAAALGQALAAARGLKAQPLPGAQPRDWVRGLSANYRGARVVVVLAPAEAAALLGALGATGASSGLAAGGVVLVAIPHFSRPALWPLALR